MKWDFIGRQNVKGQGSAQLYVKFVGYNRYEITYYKKQKKAGFTVNTLVYPHIFTDVVGIDILKKNVDSLIEGMQ